MDRRAFLSTSLAPVLSGLAAPSSDEFRDQFPILTDLVYLNMASMGPLPLFSSEGMRRGMEFQERLTREREYIGEVQNGVRARFAELVGADEDEIALTYATKAGEQVAIDGALHRLREGANIVTNDLHFSGSLHNLVGLRRQGVDVRIVRAEAWRVSPERMIEAIDDNTALVCVSLVSNVNGHVEDVEPIARRVHQAGGILYADIIQAAGAVPVNLHALDVDLAACNGYKHLLGVHGAGFLFVRRSLQGSGIPDRMFPGHVAHGYPPWLPAEAEEPYTFNPPTDARRYEAGHVNYIGYCACYEGIARLSAIGTAEVLKHAVRLKRRLAAGLPADRFECITPDLEASGIATFRLTDPAAVRGRLEASEVVVTLSGDRMRVSPGYFNTEADVDRLLEVVV